MYRDIAVCKFSPTGAIEWTRRYGAAKDSIDEPCKIILLDNGVLTLGGTRYAEGVSEGVMLVYSFDGQLLWNRTSKNLSFSSAAKDGEGSIYLCGSAADFSRTRSKVILSKYTASGQEQWGDTMTFEGPPLVSTVLLDNKAGCVYVLGSGTAKYTLDGRKLWQKSYNMVGPPTTPEFFYRSDRKSRDRFRFDFYDERGSHLNGLNLDGPVIRLQGSGQDADGNLYICGTVDRKVTGSDIFLCKIDRRGREVWRTEYNESKANGSESIVGLQIANGCVYVLGRGQASKQFINETNLPLKYDVNLLLKYDCDGHLLYKASPPMGLSPRVFLVQGDLIYVAAQGSSQDGELVVTRLRQSIGMSEDTGKHGIAPETANAAPDTDRQAPLRLSSEERAYRQRMMNFTKSLFKRFQSKGQVPPLLADFVMPEESLQSDIYRKWGIGEKLEFSPFEKYYIMQLPMLAQTWQMYEAVDLKNLTREEQRFLDDMHAKYGNGKINYRREAAKDEGGLEQHQQDWFDLIKAATGSDTLDDKALIFLHRMTPR